MREEDLPYSAERARQMAEPRSTQNVMYQCIDSTVRGCEAQIEEQITTPSQGVNLTRQNSLTAGTCLSG